MNAKSFLWTSSDNLMSIIELLKNGQVILGTSDTVLGLVAPLTQQGFDALNEIKGRSDKPYIVLIGDPQKIDRFVEMPLSSQVQSLITHCWPGPLTLILKAKSTLPSFLQSPDKTIALRIPNHKGLRALLQHFDGLFSTSANKASKPVPHSIDALDQEIIEQTKGTVLEYPEQKTVPFVPSTILDCTGDAVRVVREGAYPIKELNLKEKLD